jgi:hypothetical protein
MKFLQQIFCSSLLLIGINAFAIDTYNPANNQLTIPTVIVGATAYKDVVITVGSVVSIGGTGQDPKYPAKSTAVFDSYDIQKKQLSIPNVTAYGSTYHDVIINVGDILAVGSSHPLSELMPAQINIALINSIVDSELSLSNTQNDDLLQDILAIGDVNGDGYDDILIGVMRLEKGTYNSVRRSVKPILLIYDPILNKYEVSQTFKSVSNTHIWPRQAAIADFDGDGRNDIFIADHGVDGGSYNCGNPNSLVLNKITGMVNASSQLPQYHDYSHGLIAANFNKDNKTDLLVINSPYIRSDICNVPGVRYTNKSYMLAGGTFAETALTLKPNDLDQFGQAVLNLQEIDKGEHFVANGTDLNGDGITDIVLGNNGSISIIESNSIFSYNKSQTILAPAKYVALINAKGNCLKYNNVCIIPYSFVSFYDIDGDGQPEIIASLLNQESNVGWVGQYFQALKKINGVWTDITDSVFPNQSSSQSNGGEWCYKIQFADFNGDGNLDLLCSFYTSKVWTFSNGQFTDTQTIRNRTGIIKFPGASYLVNFDTYNSPNQISIAGYKL